MCWYMADGLVMLCLLLMWLVMLCLLLLPLPSLLLLLMIFCWFTSARFAPRGAMLTRVSDMNMHV